MNLSGRVALITGAAHGIGRATASRLAAGGATVLIAGRDRVAGQAVAAALGADHRFYALDVSDDANWRSIADDIRSEFGGIDIAFLNAGVSGRDPQTPLSEPGIAWLTAEVMRRVMSVNLIGVALGLMHCLPLARGRPDATIIATGSTAGIDYFTLDPLYSATKAGVLALVKALAAEFDEAGVRLCAVSPGSIDTRMYPAEMRDARLKAGTLADADFLAGAVIAILANGAPGDIWMARPEDRGYWVHQFRALPKRAAGEPLAADARFVPVDHIRAPEEQPA